MRVSAFVSEYPGLSKRLATDATLKHGGKETTVRALWDAGATSTCISKDAVTALSLVPLGKRQMHTPSDVYTANTYQIDILLPNNVIARDFVVCDSEIGTQGLGMLIGMDIISQGDFAVSNYNGKTVFTFRTPSQERTDYVKKIKIQKTIGLPHGKGKRSNNK